MGIPRGKKGAVLVEFVFAFMPICTLFLCLCQISRYAIARMVVMHAAEVSVRACAVIADPEPGSSKQVDGTVQDVITAAHTVMKPFGGSNGNEISITDPTCTHQGEPNGGTDSVTITGTYTCEIPLARNLVCATGPKVWDVTAEFPHQGATYKIFDSDPTVE